MKTRVPQRRAQSVVEYAVLFSVVAAVIIGMQLYVKRGAQAKLKQVSDHLAHTTGEGANVLNPATQVKEQYEPYYTAAGAFTTTSSSAQNEARTVGGVTTRSGIKDTTSRTGGATQGVDQKADDNWQ